MEWISVKDQMPKEGMKVLCWDEPYSSSTNLPVFGCRYQNKIITDIADDWSNVTHWMLSESPHNKKLTQCPECKRRHKAESDATFDKMFF